MISAGCVSLCIGLPISVMLLAMSQCESFERDMMRADTSCGFVARRRRVIDTLPNAVGLNCKSLSSLLGTYSRSAPQPISNPGLSSLASFPLSHLCRSQSPAASCSLSTLSPSCTTTFHIHLPLPSSPSVCL